MLIVNWLFKNKLIFAITLMMLTKGLLFKKVGRNKTEKSATNIVFMALTPIFFLYRKIVVLAQKST